MPKSLFRSAAIGLALATIGLVPVAIADDAKPTIVLLHGAFEDSTVWADTQMHLEAAGYVTRAINLPGRPPNGAASGAQTLAGYRDAVLAVIDQEAKPVVLVGHSFGGMTISNVAEARPERIRSLVYVAAYLPSSGQALTDLSAKDSGSQAGPAFRIDGERGVASIAKEARAGLFCNDCAPDIAATMPDQMVEEPLPPLATPVTLTAERFGTVDKAYIRTAKDRVVSPVLQDAMLATTPVRKTVTLDAGHAPFLSMPDKLAVAIMEVVQ